MSYHRSPSHATSDRASEVSEQQYASSSTSIDDKSYSQPLPSPLETVGPSRDEVVLGFYFATFVNPFPIRPKTRTYFNIMPRTYLPWQPNSALEAAMMSMAHSRYRVAPGADLSQCVQEGRAHYHVALERIRNAIAHRDEAITNETLLAVLLMQIIEAELSTNLIMSGHSMHASGAWMLINMRGRDGFQDDVSKKVLESARGITIMNDSRQMMIRQDRFSRYPVRTNFGVPFLDDAVSTERVNGGTEEDIVCPTTHVAHLWQDAETLLNQPPEPQTIIEVENLAARSGDTDRELIEWVSRSFPGPQTLEMDASESSKTPEARYWGRLDAYDSIVHARSWNELRIARMVAKDVELRCCKWLLGIDGTSQGNEITEYYRQHAAELEQTLRSLIDDICASAPFFFGLCANPPIDPHPLGYYALFPILVLCQASDLISLVQRQWILIQLAELQYRIGIHETRAGMAVRGMIEDVRQTIARGQS